MNQEQFWEYVKNDEEVTHTLQGYYSDQPTKEKGEKIMKKLNKLNKKRVIKGAVLVGAGILLYRLGEQKGFDLGYELGELNGFRDAVKAVTENAVDAYNLGDLESFGE